VPAQVLPHDPLPVLTPLPARIGPVSSCMRSWQASTSSSGGRGKRAAFAAGENGAAALASRWRPSAGSACVDVPRPTTNGSGNRRVGGGRKPHRPRGGRVPWCQVHKYSSKTGPSGKQYRCVRRTERRDLDGHAPPCADRAMQPTASDVDLIQREGTESTDSSRCAEARMGVPKVCLDETGMLVGKRRK
jgi:hypothetical protein